MKAQRLYLDAIEAGERLRPLDPAHVNRLAASIKHIGLHTPITVRAEADGDDTRLILVAGAHRLEALRQLGEDATECFVLSDKDDCDLWEIEENFARSELSDAQRADHHVRREAILIRRKEVLPGRGKPSNTDKLSELKAYSRKAAADLGVDERTVQRDLRRGKNIDPEILAEVSGTNADKGVVLDRLASEPRENQRAVLAEMQQHQEGAKLTRSIDKTVAADPLNNSDAHEKQLVALMSAWNRAVPRVREQFLRRVDKRLCDRVVI